VFWVQHTRILSALQLVNILVSSNLFGCFPTQAHMYIIKGTPKNVSLSTHEEFFSPFCRLLYLPAVSAKKKFQNDNTTFPQTARQGFFLQQPPLIRRISFTSRQKLQGQKSYTASRNCHGRERKVRLNCHFQPPSTQQYSVKMPEGLSMPSPPATAAAEDTVHCC